MAEAGRDIRVCPALPLLPQGHPEQRAQGRIQTTFGDLQEDFQ